MAAVAHTDLTSVRQAIEGSIHGSAIDACVVFTWSLNEVACRATPLTLDPAWDDGSWGPLYLRLAWHCCGTYSEACGNGGSNGGTMRFKVEQADPENAGLSPAIARLDTIHAKHAELSKADLYVLAGYVAIEVMGGPSIPFGIGRKDYTVFEAEEVHGATGCPFGDGKEGNPHGSRLPAADLGSDPGCPMKAGVAEREAATIKHIRATFTRLTMSDRETVALIVLGHQFGRCHLESSGFDGPWYAFDPTHWNVYENGLGYLSLYEMGLARGGLHETTTAKGNRQYELTIGWAQEKFMMLPADAALWWDPAFRKEIQRYDRNRLAFRHEASAAWKKLTELGCEGLLATETTPARNP